MLLMSSELGVQSLGKIQNVDIPFPDGSRVSFKIHNSKLIIHNSKLAWASVIKDAGDDPDVTNGAEIRAEIRIQDSGCRIQDEKEHASCIMYHASILIRGGKGVGVVTKPGLSVPVGEPAINPVPKKMIKEAVTEAITESGKSVNGLIGKSQNDQSFFQPIHPFTYSPIHQIEITISVTDGESLAKKTLNQRLGIIGGISILGTTGIVKPISAEAWTATIRSSMDVAKAMGQNEIVLSAGRASEKAHIRKYNLPEECYVMMGDYLEFSLLEAKKHEFKKIHLCAQWAKMLKIAMATPQTHVRHGAIDLKKAVEFLRGLGVRDWGLVQDFNTAMEIFNFIVLSYHSPIHPVRNESLNGVHPFTHSPFLMVCSAAKRYAEEIVSGMPVNVHLVSYEGDIIETSG